MDADLTKGPAYPVPDAPDATPDTPAATEATPQAPVEPPAPPAPVVPQESDADKLAQKYRVLQGKYEAEVPRLAHQNQDLQRQLAEMKDRLEAVLNKPADEPKKPLVTEKDVEDFGADMVDMVRRTAQATIDSVLAREMSQLLNRLSTLENTVNGVAGRQMMTEEQRFYAELEKEVPNWKQIDTEEGWLNWLTEEDPLSGEVRQELLNRAVSKKDAARVAKLFKAYAPAKPAPAAPSKSELERQVAPSRASASNVPTRTEKQTWNDAAVNAFYADIRKGKFAGREAEMQQIENDIHAAVAEGRYMR